MEGEQGFLMGYVGGQAVSSAAHRKPEFAEEAVGVSIDEARIVLDSEVTLPWKHKPAVTVASLKLTCLTLTPVAVAAHLGCCDQRSDVCPAGMGRGQGMSDRRGVRSPETPGVVFQVRGLKR